MKAMPVQPSSKLAYLDPLLANAHVMDEVFARDGADAGCCPAPLLRAASPEARPIGARTTGVRAPRAATVKGQRECR